MRLSDRSPRLLDGRVIRGCNVHHRATVFVQRVDLGGLAGLRTGGVGTRFDAGYAERFGSLPANVPIEQALLAAIVAVERHAGRAMHRLDTPTFSTLARDPRAPRTVDLVWECQSGTVSRGAAKAAFAGLLELISGSVAETKGGFSALMGRLERRCRRRQWSPATAALALAAKERGVPFESLAGQYLRLGEGVMQQVVSTSPAPEGGAAILDRIFPAGTPGGIPVALILGRREAGSVARDLDALLRASGHVVGLSTRKLSTIDGRPIDSTSHGRSDGARFLLGDPRIEILVAAISPARVVERGLRLDRASVAAILEREPDDDPDVHRRGIEVVLSATTGAVVVDAGHPWAGRLVRERGHERVVLLSSGPPGPLLARHLARGGSAAVRAGSGRREAIELRVGNDTVGSVRPTALHGRRRSMVTAALAFGLGLTGGEVVTAVEKRRFPRSGSGQFLHPCKPT